MKIDTTYRTETFEQRTTQELPQQTTTALRVLQIEPEDSVAAVVTAIQVQDTPVILLLPEETSGAFSDAAHFTQLKQVISPEAVSFVIPRSRIPTAGRSAKQEGFSFASSVEKATQLLPAPHTATSSIAVTPGHVDIADEPVEQEAQTSLPPQQASDRDWSPPPISVSQQETRPGSPPTPPRQSSTRRMVLIATMVAVLVIGGAVLLPALFSTQTGLTRTLSPAAPAVTSVGQLSFTSSGQLDPVSSKGLNDGVTLSLHHLSTPAQGKGYYAWLMPDKSDDNTVPLLLGKLVITQGDAQITYQHPDHMDLLASYSGFEVAEQEENPVPTTPPLDPKTWRYSGTIPAIPTPGDEQHYTLLDHMRHLLAKDPTLQQIGLQGGLDTWLYRNTEKVLEWSSAARDSWASQQTDLIHRHMLRILQYLDGAAYVYNTGDIPPGSPLLIDPLAGRIGLLEVQPTQSLPGYLTHVDIHLQGMTNAPGHTEAQKQLAIKIDNALKADAALLQHVHKDAITLVQMNTEQLKGNDALTLLNDLTTAANTAYTGQFDPQTGGNINGISWIHNELQGLAIMSVTTASATHA